MIPTTRQRPWPAWFVMALVLLPAGLGLYALAGWVLALPSYVQPAATSIPMAPSTAVLFILLGGAAFWRTHRANDPGAPWALLVGGLAAVVGATLAVTSASGLFFDIEHLGLYRAPSAAGVPLGHMSPATAALFLASSLSLLAAAPEWGRRPRVGDAARGFAALVTVVGFVLILTYIWSVEPLYAALLVPPAATTSLGFFSLGLGLFGLPTVLDGRVAENAHRPATMSATYILAISAFAFGSVAIGYLTYRNYEQTHRTEVERQLTLIGELKVGELVNWRAERLGNAAVIADNEVFAALVGRFLADPRDAAARDSVRQRMGSYVAAYGYRRAILVEADGSARMSVPDDGQPASPHLISEAGAALPSGDVGFVDLSRDGPNGPMHLAVVAPILAGGVDSPPAAAVVLQIDPETYVYPLIRSWPTGSRTAETFLVRREGDEVVYLNDLRFQPGTALALRVAASQTYMPAAAAVGGVTGIFEGVDYRGEPVLAYLSPVEDSPWFLVTRMDIDEVYAPMRERLVQTVIMVGLLVSGAAAGVGLLWRQERLGQNRVQAALQASEVRLQTTMDSMLEGAQIIGFDYRYLYVNDAVAAQGKQPKAELVSRTMMERYPGIDQTEFFGVLRRCMEQREPQRMENEFTFPDGSVGWFDLSLQPVPQGVFILSQDITERKRAEAALRRHTNQVEALNRVARIVSSSLDLDEVYDGFVAELRPLLPIDRTSITRIDEVGQRWSIVRQWTAVAPTLTPGTWHPLAGSFAEAVLRSGRPLLESPIDPEARWAESPLLRAEGMQSRIVVPLVVKDRVTGTVSVASLQPGAFSQADVHLVAPMVAHLALAVENIRLYESEREHAATLEQRVAERTAALEAANQELEAFSYSVSHDLRAPLRAADGFSRILLDDFAGALDPEARRYLDLVRSSTQQMGRLIDDLLSFSRLSRQELTRRRVDPAVVARQALAQVQPDGAGRGVEIEIDDMPTVDADPSLLRQVYVNLISNALKFTHPRSPARIRVGARPLGGETVYFVDDNGVGFDMAYAGKLFGVFQRLHRAEDYEGTGVGLAIVQRIVHRHGGKVWAEGTLDRGATFFFTMPRRREP